jgi:hypothetical protein
MTILIPVLILFTILQVVGYWYTDRQRIQKGRLKTFLVIVSLYFLVALLLPLSPDDEYMNLEVIIMIKTGIVLIGTVFAGAIHLMVKFLRK